jgi:outer membrane lipoprotein-sorting protein
MQRTTRPLVLAALLSLTICSSQAQDTKSKRDPKVQAVIDQAMAAYKGLNALHLKVSVKATGTTEMFVGAPDSVEIKYQKPNKLHVLSATRGQGDVVNRREVVTDGVSVWTWNSGGNSYSKLKAPPAIKSISTLSDDLPEYDLLFKEKDPFLDIPGAAGALTLAPAAKLGDVDVDVLAATITEAGVPFTLNVKILIGQKDHLIHGMQFDGSGKDPAGKDTKFDLKMNYDIVNSSPTFAPADFTFTPPPGAKLAPTVAAPIPAAETQKTDSAKQKTDSSKPKPKKKP